LGGPKNDALYGVIINIIIIEFVHMVHKNTHKHKL